MRGRISRHGRGDLLIGGLAGQGLVRVAGDGSDQLARWDLDMRVRDVAVGPGGQLWILEDGGDGQLFRLRPN